ncbi:MAG: molybdopterin adenylyltransferase [Candidatus Omnitrophica bacterium]|nr:molybdopterin adenylyltransferase [Candidatus Omnitrophota bacterium]
MTSDNQIRIGILTISDRVAQGQYEDISGKTIEEILGTYLKNSWNSFKRIVSDDKEKIETELIRLSDQENCSLIITTGGTGPGERDVTPEAAESVCDKMLPGFGELMRRISLEYVPTAILSRQTAGIRNKALILNLPGNPNAIAQCLEAVFPAIPDCLEVIANVSLECDEKIIKVHHSNHKKLESK